MGRMTQGGWEYMIDGDLAWLQEQPPGLERDHIEAVLRDVRQPQPTCTRIRDRVVAHTWGWRWRLRAWWECRHGRHAWKMEGGRPCPRDVPGCSQAAYRCARPGCGAYDYGEPGGPGAADCIGCTREQEQDCCG